MRKNWVVRAVSNLSPYLILPDWWGETCHGYVIGVVRFRGFGDLTCDFWAENEEKNCKNKKGKDKAKDRSRSSLCGEG
jgi:hypothetical protein